MIAGQPVVMGPWPCGCGTSIACENRDCPFCIKPTSDRIERHQIFLPNRPSAPSASIPSLDRTLWERSSVSSLLQWSRRNRGPATSHQQYPSSRRRLGLYIVHLSLRWVGGRDSTSRALLFKFNLEIAVGLYCLGYARARLGNVNGCQGSRSSYQSLVCLHFRRGDGRRASTPASILLSPLTC
ncbi:hypothetical protein SISSUDRAFT_1047913 [Sistotremastrum suecicum HHB10207 ss-3]|uniref:Uncharacterized protein n=1 Tax=Sistotremastrum suecicum HHB10207 ss-3 TaxID=1314776 RepID=A0A166CUL7_9AGAM|nr:hypothetical protein SISSUDRAFT_1047913 [Sistotremastrum suecicum HHB10207 ss-3]